MLNMEEFLMIRDIAHDVERNEAGKTSANFPEEADMTDENS